MNSFTGFLVLALVACISAESLTERASNMATDAAMSRVGNAIGVDGVSVDKLTSKDGLTELATKSALNKAGNMIGVEGLTVDKLTTREGLTEIAKEGAKTYVSAQVDASPMGPLIRFGLAAAGYPDTLKPVATYTPQGKVGQWATSLGTYANSKVKGAWGKGNATAQSDDDSDNEGDEGDEGDVSDVGTDDDENVDEYAE